MFEDLWSRTCVVLVRLSDTFPREQVSPGESEWHSSQRNVQQKNAVGFCHHLSTIMNDNNRFELVAFDININRCSSILCRWWRTYTIQQTRLACILIPQEKEKQGTVRVQPSGFSGRFLFQQSKSFSDTLQYIVLLTLWFFPPSGWELGSHFVWVVFP